jgi:hydrogenase-4 component B
MVAGLLSLAAACLLGSIPLAKKRQNAWLALTLSGVLAGFSAALAVLLGPGDWEWKSLFLLGGEKAHLRLDALSAMFLSLVCVIGGAGAVYSREYWSERDYPASAGRGRAWWSALVLCMGLVLTNSNGLHFLIAWEAFAICGYFLVTLDHQSVEARKAGWLYLAASHAGTMGLFAFFTTLASRTGSWDLGPMANPGLAPLFWLALFGFGMKAGFFPCHIWLPSAHANAPSHVSAIMSGVAIKMGVYGIARFSGWMPVPATAGYVVIGIGATSALLGIAFGLAQNDFKRLLAYCSVENVGVVLVGLGGALLARTHGNAPWGRLALAGAFLHVCNHCLFKSLLFFGAGSVLHATGTREMSRLGGLWRSMPWTAGLFALGTLAVAGLPPLNGFVSEWLIYLGLFDAVIAKTTFAWAAIPATIMLAMAGALALASFTKAGATIFLGAARTKAAEHSHECGTWMRLPMLALSAACLAFAFLPALLWRPLSRVVGVWHPGWADPSLPAPLGKLGSVQTILAILAAAAGGWLWKKARANGFCRNLTWDCGYRAPISRMQYTSGSFAEVASGWFSWIFKPELKIRRPRGLFPEGSLRVERVPETVLERLIAPVGTVIMRVSSVVRGLQRGHLQAYILYLVAGLVAIGLFVFMGGSQ